MNQLDMKYFGLGRIPHFDKRSRNYPVRALISPAKLQKPPRSYTWRCDATLNQGPDGACTGFAVTHEAIARPKVIRNLTYTTAMEVYNRAKELDYWPGENYEGSSVLAAMKAGVERGWYSGYYWAFGEEDLSYAIGHEGPAVLGINWYEDMFYPDNQGVITIGGKVAGGHAILCNGYNERLQMYRLHNSWGPNWGINGECFISVKDMYRLLDEKGEACCPSKRLFA